MSMIGTSTVSRLCKAVLLGMSIILLAFASAPSAVRAAGPEQVNIINGKIDVNRNGQGGDDNDDLTDVLLAFGNAALIQVNIINGEVDVNKSGVIAPGDYLHDVDLTVTTNGTNRISDQVDIIEGKIDVNENGGTIGDNLNNVILTRIYVEGARVNIVGGKVDVDRDGRIRDNDDLAGVLLAFDDAALIQVNIINGEVDVNKSGVIASGDYLYNVDLTVATAVSNNRISDQVDIINQGKVDVNENRDTADDNLNDVSLVLSSIVDVPFMSRVNIINGQVDVDRDGDSDTADQLDYVLLAFDDAALIEVHIIGGKVDVNGDWRITAADDLRNAYLTVGPAVSNNRISYQVDIIDGKIDVNDNGVSNADDDLNDVRMMGISFFG